MNTKARIEKELKEYGLDLRTCKNSSPPYAVDKKTQNGRATPFSGTLKEIDAFIDGLKYALENTLASPENKKIISMTTEEQESFKQDWIQKHIDRTMELANKNLLPFKVSSDDALYLAKMEYHNTFDSIRK